MGWTKEMVVAVLGFVLGIWGLIYGIAALEVYRLWRERDDEDR